MTHFKPRTELSTHEVFNQSEPMTGYNAFSDDVMVREAIGRTGAKVHAERLSGFGARIGSQEVQDWAVRANANPPVFKPFDRFGQRLDEVEFHPDYHNLMDLGLSHGVSSAAWTVDQGGHSLHAALLMLMGDADAGVCCPMSMTYACVPALRHADWAGDWIKGATAGAYDPRFLPANEKSGLTLGMAMTEKQGGSDVRANTTQARPIGGDEVELTGHKWFCSAPMSDAFLTLAYLEGEEALSCFLVPRWRPDGTRNTIEIQRLKDKLGDKSNASSEIEYKAAWARRVGEPGRGVRTIIEMVNHTRLDCLAGSAGLIRQAAAAAVWHSDRRNAFQRRLVDQPLMREVLAELSMEADGVIALAFRVSESFDRAGEDEHEAALARVLTPLAKYWICKRAPYLVYEAMEAHGGAGYVEEHPLPRMFRQSPLNAIWEGSGNVIALDVLRALSRDTAARDALARELSSVTGRHPALDARIRDLSRMVETGVGEADARRFAEHAALALTAASLIRAGLDPVAEAFIGRRIEESAIMLGAGSARIDSDTLIGRARLTV
ncbi:acyl-CoA dehydrogenase [Marinicauda pacifica]|uniref:DNA alkylation response protein n=1 Tax=Marinicauda pacifica TaxID=1133559 RepID=A0A4S2H7C3_9PROT|nr:acyl-CoA dehydrogenase family protein [Marinicauda pacifica]TGY91707.1 DNA alkylation response protein [Marinicauda pacifica]GGE50747.1 acyl-CoA dehydrogenase [Marinicauda pacifica]